MEEYFHAFYFPPNYIYLSLHFSQSFNVAPVIFSAACLSQSFCGSSNPAIPLLPRISRIYTDYKIFVREIRSWKAFF